MSKRPVSLLIDDRLEAIAKIERYRQDLTETTFLGDEKTTDAVVRNLEIIGEAANRLPEDFKRQHATVEWTKIVGLRHRIVHDYFGVDLQLLWQIIQNHLPALQASLRMLRSTLGSS